MKKIINHRKYDTETAEEVGFDSSISHGYGFDYWQETLYKKKTGEYFLHGQGGAMSKYAVYGDNCSMAGEDIIPMTDEEAFEWCISHLSVDEVEEIFGEIAE